jgi:hypothetical protein
MRPLRPRRLMVGSIVIVSFAFAFAAIAWSSYMLPPTVITNHILPSSSFSTNNDLHIHNNFLRVSTVESPYKHHWPGNHLPYWATKEINYKIPREREICFTHVGKAGGSTVGCSLGFSLHCHDDNGGDSAQIKHLLSSSLLSKLTTHAFHKDVYNCDDDSGYFLFVIRDPISRAKSAFNYDRSKWAKRKARFYYQCPFYHMEDFVQNGLRKEGKASDRCKRRALDSIQGIDESDFQPAHWYYNYQYYFEAIPPDSKILVIRNEHIEEDIRVIEDLFGSHEQERLTLSKSMNTNTRLDQADLYLSDESISILCHALCNEIQVYKKVLRQALNISQDQLRVSLIELKETCPDEAIAKECSDVMPDISEKLRENRGYGDLI